MTSPQFVFNLDGLGVLHDLHDRTDAELTEDLEQFQEYREDSVARNALKHWRSESFSFTEKVKLL